VRSLTLIVAPCSRGVDSVIAPHLSGSQLAATEQLSAVLVDSVSLRPSPLLTAARQQGWRGAKMINNDIDWQSLGVHGYWLRQITRMVASNTRESIGLCGYDRSEP